MSTLARGLGNAPATASSKSNRIASAAVPVVVKLYRAMWSACEYGVEGLAPTHQYLGNGSLQIEKKTGKNNYINCQTMGI